MATMATTAGPGTGYTTTTTAAYPAGPGGGHSDAIALLAQRLQSLAEDGVGLKAGG